MCIGAVEGGVETAMEAVDDGVEEGYVDLPVEGGAEVEGGAAVEGAAEAEAEVSVGGFGFDFEFDLDIGGGAQASATANAEASATASTASATASAGASAGADAFDVNNVRGSDGVSVDGQASATASAGNTQASADSVPGATSPVADCQGCEGLTKEELKELLMALVMLLSELLPQGQSMPGQQGPQVNVNINNAPSMPQSQAGINMGGMPAANSMMMPQQNPVVGSNQYAPPAGMQTMQAMPPAGMQTMQAMPPAGTANSGLFDVFQQQPQQSDQIVKELTDAVLQQVLSDKQPQTGNHMNGQTISINMGDGASVNIGINPSGRAA